MRPLLATVALLVLGAAAFARLPLDYLPRQSFPELTVSLGLPEARDPEEVTRTFVEPIESAVRALGRVRGTDGEVRPDGAGLRVRFAPGTDPGRKAARLASDLAGLRPHLPPGAALRIEPADREGGELLAIVWLLGALRESDAERAAETLRSIPGVRGVEVWGAGHDEVRVELAAGLLDPRGTAREVRAAVEGALRAPRFGTVRRGDQAVPVVSAPLDPAALALLPLPVPGDPAAGTLPLGSLATLRERRAAPALRVRYRGQPAFALIVARSPGTPLLATDTALRQRVAALPAGLRGVVDQSDAEPLRTLLTRLLLGALLASLAAVFLGGTLAGRAGALSLGLAIPAGAAAAGNAFWIAGLPLHLGTLPALALGVAAAFPGAALRLGRPGGRGFLAFAATALAAAATLPATLPLAGPALEPLLGEPARAFFLAAAAAILATALLPGTSPPIPLSHRPPFPRERGRHHPRQEKHAGGGSPSPGRWGGDGRGGQGVRSLQRRALRDPGTALLGLTAAGALTAVLCGGALVPRSADFSPDAGLFTLFLPLPEGSTQEEAERLLRGAEKVLLRTPEVVHFWTGARAGGAFAVAQVRPGDRQPDRLAALTTRLRYQISGAAAARITTGLAATGGRGLRLDPEERAEADDEGFRYRAILRSADLGALRIAHERLLDRLRQVQIRRYWVTAWEPPSIVLSLHPRRTTPAATASELAVALRAAGSPPAALRLPRRTPESAERTLVVVPAGTPLDPERHIPATGTLLTRPLLLGRRVAVPNAALTLHEEAVQPRVARQSGRFVLPIEVQLPLNSEELRLGRRKEMNRSLAHLALPPGVDLERPSLSPAVWESEGWRLLLPALLLPLLLVAVAAWRLGAPLRALGVLVPLGAGLIAATPVIRIGLGQIDEPGLFAVAAALALVLAPVTELAAAGSVAAQADTPGRLWRTLRRETPWLLAATVPLVLLLAAPTLGADALRFRWVIPLRAAGLAAGAALLTAALVTPPLRLAAARWRQRNPEETRRRHHPPVWDAPVRSTLEVRGLTKIYGAGAGRRPGFRALSALTFRLEPGIIGLLGPNGAGKTTLLRLLTGLLEPTRGHVLFRGVPVTADNLAAYRRRIGFLPQEFNAYPDFTAEQFLDHWAREHGLGDPRERAAEIERRLAAVDLTEHARRKVRDFSGGMRQRVGIARALLGAPDILIVDEPTTGLDIESRSRFRELLLEQAADRIVLFSTHIASDVEAAARRILLLYQGRLRFDGPPEELVARARGRVFRTVIDDAALADIGHHYRVTARVRRLEGIEIRAVARAGQPLAGEAVEPSLEEAYLAEVDRAEAG